MSLRAATTALLLAGMLTGCATAVPVIDFYEADSSTLRQFRLIEVFDGEYANTRDLGVVEGIYCKRIPGHANVDHPLAEAQAVDQVKLKAAAIGASHITAPQCVRSDSTDFGNNCYATLVCSASALKPDN